MSDDAERPAEQGGGRVVVPPPAVSAPRSQSLISRNRWLLSGFALLVGAVLWSRHYVPAEPADVKTFGVFSADGSFATLAGFTVLALSLERLSEAVLAPWWGKASIVLSGSQLQGAGGIRASRGMVGQTGAALARSDAYEQKSVAEATGGDVGAAVTAAEAADSAWVKTTQDRPTIILPAAAIATVFCAYMHLFLLHSIATKAGSGLPASHFAFVADALLSGLAVAGGAKPFHDFTESLAASSASTKTDVAKKSEDKAGTAATR